jgi:hypothetical protein
MKEIRHRRTGVGDDLIAKPAGQEGSAVIGV